jgi:dUTP pyrophosphatase
MSETFIPYTLTPDDGVIGHDLKPLKAHADDAAYDLRAAEECFLFPRERYTVKTGVRLALPKGFAGQILPRSGLADKRGITVLNAPGLIDPGYRGEIGVVLWNTGSVKHGNHEDDAPFWVRRGDRIAQLLIIRTADVKLYYVNPKNYHFYGGEQAPGARGEGGFGSTGR